MGGQESAKEKLCKFLDYSSASILANVFGALPPFLVL